METNESPVEADAASSFQSTDQSTKQSGDPIEQARATLVAMKRATRGRPATTCDERLELLARLEQTLLKKKSLITDAIASDFSHRSKHETLIAEVFVSVQTIRYTRDHLRGWMEPQERRVAMTFFPGRAQVLYQPLGVIGIISPWNYPFQLAISPIITAIAAGNRVMLKPSELTPATSALLKDLLGKTFGDDIVHVTLGGTEVGEAFAHLPFDHLLFTGSTRVGKLVMRAASENLTPVTLELGGKSPTIVGPDASIDSAASKIMMGKLFNAGQTCIAPDYVLVPEAKRDALVDACKAQASKMYPSLQNNPDYTAIVSERHHARLTGLVEDARDKGADVLPINPAGESFTETRKLAPVLLRNVSDEMTVMQDEIFGPLLPFVPYKTLGDAIEYVNERPRPLALYYFGHREKEIDRVIQETISGGVTVNDTMLHFAQEDLPFGGVGASGLGHYHAFEGFETFSKKKPVFYQSRLSSYGLMKPPFGRTIQTILKVMIGS